MVFRKDIQGWRAIAFLMVFIFHLNKNWWPGGFLGVDVFFVISGYLMTTIIFNKIEKNEFNFIKFLKDRVLRIVPAYYSVLLFVLMVGSYIYLSVDSVALSESLKTAFSFISNRYFSSGESYFGAQLNENPVLHTWSLSIEMQFYLLLPLVMLLFRKHVKFGLLAMAVLLTIYAQYFGGQKDGSMYFSLLGRIPEFLVGSLFALFFPKGLSVGSQRVSWMSIVALIFFLIYSFQIDENTFSVGIISLLPCLAIGLLLSLQNSFVSKLFSNPILTYIGNLSYSLYLWHWPLIAFIRYKYGVYDLSTKQTLFVVVMTFGLSWLSYNFIEKRFKTPSRTNIVVLAIASVLIFGFSYFLPRLMSGKASTEIYTQPVFGLKSHKFPTVEKFGDPSSNDAIFLFGDSNALMLKPFFDRLGQRHHFSFNTLTCDGYLPLADVKFEEKDKSLYHMYEDAQKLVPAVERELEKARFIILCTVSFGDSPSVQNAIKKLIKNLKPDKKLILINSFAYVDKDPIRVNGSFVKTSDEKFSVIYRTKNLPFLNSVANDKNVFVYDLGKSDWFKSAPYVNDTVMYYNATHLNTVGSKKLADNLDQDFMKFFEQIKKQP